MLNLKNNIFYVGVKDCSLGAYNNAYLVKGEKTALIDTVSEELSQSYISNIEEILPVKEINYLICNHSEPDKSGAVKRILELNPDIEVIGTIAAIKNLKEITNMNFNEHIAKNGTALDLGNGSKLKFCIAPNINWPDTMFTYELQSKTLFSCDMFSAYYDCDVMDTDTDFNNYEYALKSYYNRYFTPFGGFIQNAAEKISAFDVQLICTGCGPVIEKNISNIVETYKKWSNPNYSDIKTVAVFYSSRYGSTAKMAAVIEKTLAEGGVNVKVFNELSVDLSETLNNSDALIFGTPTVNKNAVREVRDAIAQLNPICVKGKPYFVFGSYGWSGEGIQLVNDTLKLLKLKLFKKPFGVLFSPSDKDIEELTEYTEQFSGMLQNI